LSKVLSSLIVILLLTSCASNKLSFDKELSEFEYPFEVKTFVLNSQRNELNMRYMDIGNGSKTVVLLHGKNFAGFYWERVAKDLVEKGYRVIIPDQIGFGKSSKPESYQYSFAQLAHNTNLLLKSINVDKFSVVGHSMGGMLAVNMSYLFTEKVEKLVLINSIGLETYLDYTKFKDTDFFYKNELNKTLSKARNYQRRNYYDGQWSDEYEKLLIPLKGQLSGDEWNIVAWSNALTYGPIFTDDIVSKLPKIKNKTYLIMGTRDKTAPGRKWKKEGVNRKMGRYDILPKEAMRMIKGSQLRELPGLGHMPHFEDYSTFSKVFFKIFK
jgi:pimeloyl-ACP methyl ester carboxylesterase